MSIHKGLFPGLYLEWFIHACSKVQFNGTFQDKDNLSTKDKGPTHNVSVIRKFHCYIIATSTDSKLVWRARPSSFSLLERGLHACKMGVGSSSPE